LKSFTPPPEDYSDDDYSGSDYDDEDDGDYDDEDEDDYEDEALREAYVRIQFLGF
jgi:hypothetical protein